MPATGVQFSPRRKGLDIDTYEHYDGDNAGKYQDGSETHFTLHVLPWSEDWHKLLLFFQC